MPFRHHDRSHDLRTRIDWEIRERIEEAVDHVCLEALVTARRMHGRPAPVADDADDRREYEGTVRDFLRRLDREIGDALDAEQRRGLGQRRRPGTPREADDEARLVAVQVTLARTLPDYWQRFERVSAAFLATPTGSAEHPGARSSGGERGGLLGRLFGRG